MESKEEAERADFSELPDPELEELPGFRVAARLGSIRRVGANESVSEAPHDGHAAESSRISAEQLGQRIIGGGLYHRKWYGL
jgi:hypothetical protein